MANFLTKLFGTKSDRDLKALQPFLEKTKKAYEQVKEFTNDELRERTTLFRNHIAETIKEEEEKIP